MKAFIIKIRRIASFAVILFACIRVDICSGALTVPDDWIVADNGDASTFTDGVWVAGASAGFYGTGYEYASAATGDDSMRLIPTLQVGGNYQVYLTWVANINRAPSVPVTIHCSGGDQTVYVNQQLTGSQWVFLGTFPFEAGTSGYVLIETAGTSGYVVGDAAAWVLESGDLPELNVSATDPVAQEGDAANTASFTITRTGSTNTFLSIKLGVSGTATVNSDYDAISTNNLFLPGNLSRTLQISSLADGIPEGDESVVLTLLTSPSYTLGSNTSATVTIQDSSFDAWRFNRFTADELSNTNLSSAQADPDGNGISNLGEFFAGSSAGPRLGMETGSNMVVTLARDISASGLDVGLETSNTLTNWQSVFPAPDAEIQSGSSNEMLRFTIPSTNASEYLRARITDTAKTGVSAESGAAFWSFDTLPDGAGSAVDTITYQDGLSTNPVVSQAGTGSAGVVSGGASSFVGPDGNIWLGSGDSGHSLEWEPGSGNEFSIEISTLRQKDIRIRFDVCSTAPTNFTEITYDTGTGTLPVPVSAPGFAADGQFHEWSIDLSSLDTIEEKSSVILAWKFKDLAVSPAESLRIDNLVVSGTGEPESELVRKLKLGRLQTVVAYGTSLTIYGAWVDQLDGALDVQYPGLATVINSGGSGQTSGWGVTNLDTKVIASHPDTVFIEFSMNDAVERFSLSVEQAQSNLENMIDRILASNPTCEIILMTMTPGNGPPEGDPSYRLNIEAYYAMYRDVAKQRGLRIIDHYPRWIALQTHNPSLFNSYVPDTIHPSTAGNTAIVTPKILEALGL